MLRSLPIAVALALVAAAPASAAPTLAALKPCYVAAQPGQRELIQVSAGGFAPLAPVDLYIDEILQQSPTAAFDGTLSGTVQAPWIESGQRVFSLRLAEHNAPTNTVATSSRVTRLAVEQAPRRAATGQRVRFKGSGFTNPQPVYAHYVFAGKSRRTVKLGTPKTSCGHFSVRRKQFPFKKSPRVGVWTIQFDQQPRYDPQAPIRVPLTVTVRKRIKPQRADLSR
jgi:hypothetical protein